MKKKWIGLAVGGAGMFFALPISLAILAPALMVVGGLADHTAADPPPFPQSPAFSDQWINLSEHVVTANHVYGVIPNSVWISLVQTLSTGAVLANQTQGHGLFASSNPRRTGHPLADFNGAVPQLAHVWQSTAFKKFALAAFLNTRDHPPAGALATVKSDITALSTAPVLAAWPATGWHHGQWQYPSGSTTKTWVLVAGSAPVGIPQHVPWKPPTCVDERGKRVCFPNLLSVATVQPPTSVTIRSDGYNGPMPSSLAPAGASIPAWTHAEVWGADVVVNAQHPVTITAHWPTYSVSLTLPSPQGFSVGSGNAGNASLPTAYLARSVKAAVHHWWSDILTASRQTHVPPAWLAGEMFQESRGNPAAAYDATDPQAGALGLVQLEPGTARSLPGWYPGARANPQENLILAGELLAENYQEFHSWRLASAAYYGGAGAVLQAYGGMPPSWQAAEGPLSNYVPDASSGNSMTLTEYADAVYTYAEEVVGDEHLAGPFSS